MEKIFFIGFNRTATTSLHNFFKQNNYKSIHYQDKKYNILKTLITNKNLKRDILTGINNYDIFLDFLNDNNLEIYKDIYKEYPNSKYILQIRSKNSWILSRLNFMNHEFLKFYNNSHGTKYTIQDAIKAWYEIYDKHIDDVKTFFEGKSNFFIYDINSKDNDNYNKLIEFLDLEITKKLNSNHGKTTSKYYTINIINKTFNIQKTKEKTKETKEKTIEKTKEKTIEKTIETKEKTIERKENTNIKNNIIPIGCGCDLAKYLKENNFRKESYPLDWVLTTSLKTINDIIDDPYLILNYLSDVKDYSNYNFKGNFSASKNVKNLMYISEKYKGLIFRHFDFIYNKEERDTILRRVERFSNLLNNSEENITFIRILHLDNNINLRLKKSNILLNHNIYDSNNLQENIDNFFKILKERYNRTDDKLILIGNKNLNIKHKNIIHLKKLTQINKLYLV